MPIVLFLLLFGVAVRVVIDVSAIRAHRVGYHRGENALRVLGVVSIALGVALQIYLYLVR